MIKDSKVYDVMKWFCLITMPAIITLWNTLAPVWGLPLVQEVSITLGAIATFLGAVLGFSSAEYYKEQMEQDN